MPTSPATLTTEVERYFAELRAIRRSGGGTPERSYYPPLANLFTAVGHTLKPKVSCVSELRDQGAGHPDLGLYGASQLRDGRPPEGQLPERGVVEVKAIGEDLEKAEVREQVERYARRYDLVLRTNLREFALVGKSSRDERVLESFRLAETEEDFVRGLESPRSFARRTGPAFVEYLVRALTHRAALAEPKDLAALLASYARDGLARVEAAGETPSLETVRKALEEALGVQFKGERGKRFFRSTLVQTLFYGVFSAWVLWARDAKRDSYKAPPEGAGGAERFDWQKAVWHLRAPVLRALFHRLSDPGRLRPLGLVEVLDWTAAALDRVDRKAFFSRFREGEAVPYFYEPFLEAFDPDLRKQLGVWYTPVEVVRYMVARVDLALKEDLGIAEGLAADNVYILDPCCGTGAYLAEVLRRIGTNLEGSGLGALAGTRIKRAATERVFGFEIMPAPFVVAHLQVGLTMRELDAPLASGEEERPQVFLTNALTGWEPRVKKPLPFPELAEERDRADGVKRDRPILVILGNPPYNGFAGMAVDEERELSEAYRSTRRVRRPGGQGLNDLYVRFFRMAERRIAEKTGRGVVCFISNYSWLDGLSFTGMRERFLEAFDVVRVDCLNGDRYKTGKVAPDGSPDPSIFSTEGDPVGIQVGTAIATLVRKAAHAPAEEIGFRHLWGEGKREELLETAGARPGELYDGIVPNLRLGLPFAPLAVSERWFEWPSLPDLFPVSFPGVKTSRDPFLVDVDLDRLKKRVEEYFDPSVSHEEIARRHPKVMKTTAIFNARSVREKLLARSGPNGAGFVRYAYRPFDTRWLYWEAGSRLLDRPRADYKPHVFEGNVWLSSARHLRKGAGEPQTCFTEHLASLHLIERGAHLFPAYLRDDQLGGLGGESGDQTNLTAVGSQSDLSSSGGRPEVLGSAEGGRPDSAIDRHPNLSTAAEKYLTGVGGTVEDLFHHVLAVLHDPAYREANAGALRMEWPRIPLPGWPGGDAKGAAETFSRSAAHGREFARLLDPEAPVPGVTHGPLRPEFAIIAVPATTHGRNMTGDDFALTAGWGHFGAGQAVMPGQGRVVEREYTQEERDALGDALPTLGATTFDVHLNDRSYWRNVPRAIWGYKLGGYQVLKKWLSYREHKVLGRDLRPEEVHYFAEVARKIGGILKLANA